MKRTKYLPITKEDGIKFLANVEKVQEEMVKADTVEEALSLASWFIACEIQTYRNILNGRPREDWGKWDVEMIKKNSIWQHKGGLNDRRQDSESNKYS